MPGHPATLDEALLLEGCREERRRASGPGGQHRNKVETGVRLLHLSTGCRAEATERRSLEDNRRVALGRLRLRLALEQRAPARAQPSPLWRRRTGGARLLLSAEHADVASLLAEALDVLADVGDEVPAAAARLEVAPSRLIRLLALYPPALAALNARRVAAGLPRLRS